MELKVILFAETLVSPLCSMFHPVCMWCINTDCIWMERGTERSYLTSSTEKDDIKSVGL